MGTTVDYDVEDCSCKSPLDHGFTLAYNLPRTIVHERPAMFLGIWGFLNTLIGVGCGYWTIQNIIPTGTFSVGLAWTSTFVALAGILSACTAIILHSLKQ